MNLLAIKIYFLELIVMKNRKSNYLLYFLLIISSTYFCQNTPLIKQKLNEQFIYNFYIDQSSSLNELSLKFDSKSESALYIEDDSKTIKRHFKKQFNTYHTYKSDFKSNIPHTNIFRISLEARICDTFPILAFNYPNLQDLRIICYNDYYFSNELLNFRNLEYLNLLFAEGTIESDLRLTHFFPNFQKIKSLKQFTVSSENGGFEYIPETFFDSLKLEVFNFEVDNYQMINFPLSTFFNSNIKEINFRKHEDMIDNVFYSRENKPFLPFDYDLPILCNEFKRITSSIKPTNSFWYKKHNKKLNVEADKILKIDSNHFEIHRKNNQLLCEGSLKNKKLHGKCSVYYPSGKLKEERYYNEGKESQTWRFYDSLGILKATFSFTDSTEHFIYFFTNGRVFAELTTRNSVPEGIWLLYNTDGSLLTEKKYENGIRIYKTEYTPQSHYPSNYGVKRTLFFNRKSKEFYVNFYDNNEKIIDCHYFR